MSNIKLEIDGTEYEFYEYEYIDSEHITPTVTVNGKRYVGKAIPKESKPIQDKDYEIVSYFFNGYRWGKVGNKYYNEFGDFISIVPENAEIHSVLRISTNEVFTVGDKFKDCEGNEITIDRFEVDNDHKIKVWSKDKGYWELSSINKVKVPLFTTEDGYAVYKNDYTAYITVVDSDFSMFSNFGTDMFGKYPERKYFYDIKKAKEYILNNKPIQAVYKELSEYMSNGIRPLYYITVIDSVNNILKEFFKSKINNT